MAVDEVYDSNFINKNTNHKYTMSKISNIVLANGHITLNIPVLVRSLKSSNVEPG